MNIPQQNKIFYNDYLIFFYIKNDIELIIGDCCDFFFYFFLRNNFVIAI